MSLVSTTIVTLTHTSFNTALNRKILSLCHFIPVVIILRDGFKSKSLRTPQSILRNGGKDPLILNLDTRWWVVSFTSRVKGAPYPLKRRLFGPRSSLYTLRRSINCFCRESNHDSSVPQPVLTALSRFLAASDWNSQLDWCIDCYTSSRNGMRREGSGDYPLV